MFVGLQNASKVVALLLSHRASTDLLWSGHSPLSLAIASGNDLVNHTHTHTADTQVQTCTYSTTHMCTHFYFSWSCCFFSLQAVEELLKGGADPNIPLGHGVGSALCVLANFNYHLGGNRVKLVRKHTHTHCLALLQPSLCSVMCLCVFVSLLQLNMLAKAGADIMMPVMVGDVMGSAVDYAHFSFNQVKHLL